MTYTTLVVAVRVMQLMDFQHLLRGESVVRPYRACAYHQLAGGFDYFVKLHAQSPFTAIGGSALLYATNEVTTSL